LFEKFPGQDQWQDTIRSTIRKDEGYAEWVEDIDFGFFTVVAMLDPVCAPFERQLKNVELTPGNVNNNFVSHYLPRMLHVRVVCEHQSNWTDEQHMDHARLLASKLTSEAHKPPKKPKHNDEQQYNSHKQDALKDYVVDDDISLITPIEKLPLGAYIKKTVMIRQIIPELFESKDINQSWAYRFPNRIHEFFADGTSTEAQALGVRPDYDWKTDQYYLANCCNTTTTGPEPMLVTPVKKRDVSHHSLSKQDDDVEPLCFQNSSDESEDHGRKKLSKSEKQLRARQTMVQKRNTRSNDGLNKE
jgi:hypothetical protein